MSTEWTKEQREQAAERVQARENAKFQEKTYWDVRNDLQCELTAALEEIEKLRASTPEAAGRGDGWIDVKQELPPEKQKVIAHRNNVYVLAYRAELEYLTTDNPTHWQPLPAPPSGEQAGSALTNGASPGETEPDPDDICNCGHSREYHSGGYGDCMTGSGCDCRGFDDESPAESTNDPKGGPNV